MATERFANDVQTTLASSVDSSQGTINVASAAGFPTQPQFRLRIGNEFLLVTGVSGTSWTVSRGAEGSSGAPHTAGVDVVHVVTAGALGVTSDPGAATPGLRSLGTGATQAASGADARLSDSRTPSQHHTTHEPGGTDPMAVDAAAGTGSLRTLGSAANQAASGSHTHTESQVTNLTTDLAARELVANKDVDASLSANSDTKYASQKATKAYVDAQTAAGAPNASDAVKGITKLSTAPVLGTNPIAVGDNDPRNTNSRAPTGHHASHEPGGSDAMVVDAAAVTGSLRTLGTGATQAAAGNDSRFTALSGPGDGYIHVMDYVTGDGVTDDTANFQVAVNAAIAAGKPFYVDPGHSYLINGTVDITGSGAVDANFFHWIMPFAGFNGSTYADFASKIICGNTTAPCIRFGSATEFRAGIYVDGLKVWANAHRSFTSATKGRIPMVQFGIDQGATDFGGFGHFGIRDLWADGRDFDTDAFLFHGALNGSVHTAYTQNMTGGASFVLKADKTNTGNITFEDCFSGQAPIGWLVSEYNPLGAVLLNSLMFSNCKMLGPGDAHMTSIGRVAAGPSAANSRFVVGTVAAAGAATGQRVVPVDVTAAGKVAAGMWVTICKANGQLWVDRVSSVASPNITLATNLPAALVSGDQLVFGQWHTICGSGAETVRTVVQDLNHWENANGFLAQAVRGAEINRPFIGNGVGRGVYCAFSAQQVKVQGIQSASAINIPDNAVILHQGAGSGNARNQVRNANLSEWRTGAALNSAGGSPATNPKIIQVDAAGGSGSSTSYNERFGGVPAMLGVWHQDTTVAISQTNVQLTGPHGSTARAVRVPHYGAVVGIQVALSSPCTAGGASALVATLYKNGSATALTCTVDSTTNTTTNVAEYENTTVTLNPGDRLDVRITTSGTFAPTANDVDVTVWVEQ